MTLRVGGQPVSSLILGGQPVQRIMLGTGSSSELVWEATIYPRPGSWPWAAQSFGIYNTYSSHTIAETGTYDISLTVWSAGTVGAAVRPRISGPFGDITGSNATEFTTVTTSQTLSAGAVINFKSSGTQDCRGEWTITKTAPLY